MCTLLNMNQFGEFYEASTNKMWITFDAYLKNGSGWMLERFQKVLLNTYKYEPIQISTYIPTPKFIVKKQAVWNIQNKKNKKCFEYSVLAAKHHKEIKNNREKPSSYKKYLNQLRGCKEPMTLDDIPNFERLNNLAIGAQKIYYTQNYHYGLNFMST